MSSGCLETRSSPAWGRAGRVKSGGASQCHLTDKLVSFRLYNFSPSVIGETLGKPVGGGAGSKTAVLIYYKYSAMKPRLLRVTF